ncbi:amino acid racemase [Amycolatopsis sp. NPDC000673]|uniref:aspartate/glutamate racemase family protein n=1 Tax=Amycolatopsis sp. NPDC000673 TaxID=3154267 RepID=UPI00332E7A6B
MSGAERGPCLGGDGPLVGILGGMGPAATADFYAKLVRATPASRDQEHVRAVIWSDPLIPDRTEALLGGGPDPTPALLRGAMRLVEAGADMIVVPCNTAHAFLPRVARRIDVPIVDMIGAAAAAAARMKPAFAAVGLLATTGTVRAGLYQDRLRQVGITVLVPSLVEQDEWVMPAIRAVKAGAAPGPLLAAAAEKLIERGAAAMIAGCTEVPLGLPEALRVPVIDPAVALAEAVVARVRAARSMICSILND